MTVSAAPTPGRTITTMPTSPSTIAAMPGRGSVFHRGRGTASSAVQIGVVNSIETSSAERDQGQRVEPRGLARKVGNVAADMLQRPFGAPASPKSLRPGRPAAEG